MSAPDPRNFDLTKIKPDSLEWEVFVAARKLADNMVVAHAARAAGTEPAGVLDVLDTRTAESIAAYIRLTNRYWRERAEAVR